MMAYLRIKKIEDDLLKTVRETLNKERIEEGKEVMKDSEILHDIIIKGLKKMQSRERRINNLILKHGSP